MCIVECIYDPNETTIFKWKPLRIRDNLNPNDFVTATNVWNCIHNPVTLDMITTGNTEKETILRTWEPGNHEKQTMYPHTLYPYKIVLNKRN